MPLSCTYADPVVSVDRPDIEIPENETEVEVCFTLSTGITEQVIVTAMTGPKTGAANGATGMYYTNTLSQNSFVHEIIVYESCSEYLQLIVTM